MFVAPVGSVYVEHLHSAAHCSSRKMIRVLNVGVRLPLARLRPYFQPRFTAKSINLLKIK
jgi:hypothetical protein